MYLNEANKLNNNIANFKNLKFPKKGNRMKDTWQEVQ